MKNETIKNLTPNSALKEFIALNKKFCELLTTTNKLLAENEVSSAIAQLGLVESYNESVIELKKALPAKAEIEKTKLFEELVEQQRKLTSLIEENEHLIKMQINMNQNVAEYLSKQLSDKIKGESIYSKDGKISVSHHTSSAFAISDKV